MQNISEITLEKNCRCSKCGEWKTFIDFTLSSHPAGRLSWCKECMRLRCRKRRSNSPELVKRERKDSQRRAFLRKNGISFEEFENILIKQDYKCFICAHVERLRIQKDRLQALCTTCNRHIREVAKDISLYKKCIEYIENTRRGTL